MYGVQRVRDRDPTGIFGDVSQVGVLQVWKIRIGDAGRGGSIITSLNTEKPRTFNGAFPVFGTARPVQWPKLLLGAGGKV